MRRELGRFGPEAGIAELVERWPEAVGDVIARNAWPARIGRDGTLHVHTSSAAWAFELGQLAVTLLERLRGAVGDAAPRRLRFVVGNLPGAPPAPAPELRPPAPPPSPDDIARAAKLASSIDGDELRKIVQRAAAASLAAARSGRSFW